MGWGGERSEGIGSGARAVAPEGEKADAKRHKGGGGPRWANATTDERFVRLLDLRWTLSARLPLAPFVTLSSVFARPSLPICNAANADAAGEEER